MTRRFIILFLCFVAMAVVSFQLGRETASRSPQKPNPIQSICLGKRVEKWSNSSIRCGGRITWIRIPR